MNLDPLISTNDLGMYLQQTLTDFENEARFAVEAASSAVRAYCRRSLSYVENDERTFRWRDAITLPDAPIISIESVKIDDTIVDWYRDFSGRIVASWSPSVENFISTNNYPYPDVTITYSHGYVEIPEHIKMVTTRVAARMFKNPMQRTTYSADNLTYTTSSDVSPRILTLDEQMMLKPHRLNRTSS